MISRLMCREAAGVSSAKRRIPAHDMTAEALSTCLAVREVLLAGILRLAEDTPAASRHIRRLIILNTPPSLDAGEITDKGYINQRQSLRLRADQVERLHAEILDPAVILLAQAKGAFSHAI